MEGNVIPTIKHEIIVQENESIPQLLNKILESEEMNSIGIVKVIFRWFSSLAINKHFYSSYYS